MIIITRAQVIQRLRAADRALLPREIAPAKSQEVIASTVKVLQELEKHRLVVMNPQTDRWRYCGPEVRP